MNSQGVCLEGSCGHFMVSSFEKKRCLSSRGVSSRGEVLCEEEEVTVFFVTLFHLFHV